MSTNFIVHCIGKRDSCDNIEHLPTPKRTRTWMPIPHHNLLNAVESTLGGKGFRVMNQAYAELVKVDKSRRFRCRSAIAACYTCDWVSLK